MVFWDGSVRLKLKFQGSDVRGSGPQPQPQREEVDATGGSASMLRRRPRKSATNAGESAQSRGEAAPLGPRGRLGPGPRRLAEVYSRTRLGFGLKMSEQGHSAESGTRRAAPAGGNGLSK